MCVSVCGRSQWCSCPNISMFPPQPNRGEGIVVIALPTLNTHTHTGAYILIAHTDTHTYVTMS